MSDQRISKVQCYPVTPRCGLAVLTAPVLLILLLGGCALQKHPIQPMPKDYQVPAQWRAKGCVTSVETYHGRPVLECRDGLRMVHPKTGQQVEFVSWAEIRGSK